MLGYLMLDFSFPPQFFRSCEVSFSVWEMRGKRANCDAETAATASLVAVELSPFDFLLKDPPISAPH